MLGLASRSLESTGKAGSSAGRFKSFSVDWIAFLSIFVICILCFAKSLFGYFQSDDFTFIHHASQIWTGHPELFWRTLLSAWAESPYHLQYRPAYMLSYALEYPLWQGNPFGYHLTNFCLHLSSALLCYLVTKRTLEGTAQSNLIALSTGLLFAAHPLHSEVVSWISGRVDAICATFYLLSFWLFLKSCDSQSNKARSVSLVCFAAALLAKEMAASLPAAIFAWILFVSTSQVPATKNKIRDAYTKTAHYWFLLFAYIGIRALILGSVVGGYAGYTGQVFWAIAWQRWFGSGSLQRLFYPLSETFFSAQHPLSQAMHLLYLLCGLALALRLVTAPWSRDYLNKLAFCLAWLIISFIPVIPVWFLQANLQGSRYDYIPSIALCALLSLLLWTPAEASKRLSPLWLRLYQSISIILLSSFLLSFIIATNGNSEAWLRAARQSRAIQSQLVNAIKALPDDKKAVVLNLPKDFEGTYMFYRLDELRSFLKPPFLPDDLSARVASLEPEFFGSADLLNRQRLAEMVESGRYEFFLWDSGRLVLQSTDLPQALPSLPPPPAMPLADRQARLQTDSASANKVVVTLPVDSAPARCDWLEILAISTPKSGERFRSGYGNLYISWEKEGPEAFADSQLIRTTVTADGKPHTYLIPLGEHKSWVLPERIDRINICTTDTAASTRVLATRLRSGEQLVPVITLNGRTWREQGNGVHQLVMEPATIDFKAALSAGIESVLVEVSEQNSQFAQLSGTFRDFKPCKQALLTFRLNRSAGSFRLPVERLPKAGWYQVRIAAIDTGKEIAGYFSDPVFVSISASQIASQRRLHAICPPIFSKASEH
jgi:hypothetical protein